MNRSEVAQLLTKIAAFDRRTIGEADVLAWHEVVGDLPLKAALEAVTDYFRDTREWCMPSDIVSRVKAIRKKRLELATGWMGHLEINLRRDVDTEDGGFAITAESDAAYMAERAAVKERICDGGMDAIGYRAYRASGLPLAEFDQERRAIAAAER